MYKVNTQRLMFSLFGSLLIYGGMLAQTPEMALSQTTPEAIRNYNMGIETYSQGNSAEALRKFNRAVQIDPGYADAYYNMGSIYYQMKHYNEAVDMFQKAASLSAADSQAKYNQALALEKLSRFEEAVKVLSQIPANDPKHAQAKAKIEELRPSLKPQVAASPATKPATSPSKPIVEPKPAAKPSQKLNTQAFSKGYDGPTGIVIGPGGFMYVANYSKNQIYRVGAGGEKSTFAQGDTIKGPIGLTYNPKSNELYVANYLLNNVTRIDAAGKASVLVGGLNKPYNLFLDTVNNVLYISEQDPANQVSRVTLP